MGLPWIRLDTGFMRNPKILALLGEREAGYRAAFAWLCSLAYSGEQESDGFIPAEALPAVHARRSEALLLCRHQLWHEQPGGYLIHDWEDYQLSSAEHKRRRKRAQDAAYIRWHGTKDDPE